MRWTRTWLVLLAACGHRPAAGTDAASGGDAPVTDGAPDDASGSGSGSGSAASLTPDRDRLLASYLAYLQANPGAQTNGLDGAQLTSVCQLWSAMHPGDQAVFLTLTARMGGSIIAADGTTILSHVTKLYRAVGGQDETATDPGSCGGGEYNRMIMAMDASLQAAFVLVNGQSGGPSNAYDIADLDTGGYWRDSHDFGGPHAPFDQSDETNDGAPRGQTQYFADPTSTVATSPLGRQDLMTLVDPYALEMDQDYDCPHDSNPLCTYTSYGPLCASEPAMTGVDVYGEHYGTVDLTWTPSGC